MEPKSEKLYSFHSVQLPDDNQEWVHLLPSGKFQGKDGRGPYIAEPTKVVANSLSFARGLDLPIDYEHQAHYAKENGKPAPSAGWIKELEAREDGVWGKVEWTKSALKMIKDKEYRYLSPVIHYFPTTGEVAALSGAGLTNLPNLILTALSKQMENDNMDKTKKTLHSQLTAELNLKEVPEDDEAKIVEEVKKVVALNKENGDLISLVKKELGLDEASKTEEVLHKIKESKIDPLKSIPLSEYQKTATALQSLQNQFAEKEANDAVEKAMKEGKISPALKDWAVTLHKSDAKAFAEFVKNQPVIVADDLHTSNNTPPATISSLSETQIAVCKTLGISKDDYLKTIDNGDK